MKPLRLELTAFGSYAEPTVVPFDELEQGLYLVTGDTGAGKTTIFDAIVFALYGKASGKDRSPEMMHCDLTDKSVDTVVSLRFSQNDRVCTVTRSIHFPRKRGVEGGFGAPDIQAVLTGEGLTPVEGASRVSAACESLLGLNAEQFRKIVMLAQGEFRDFLKADSEKKTEILGKLFDSSAYVWYQRLLEGAWKKLEQERLGERERLRLLLENNLRLPEDADPARFLPGEPALLENLDQLLTEGRRRGDELKLKLSEAESSRDALLIQKTAGKTTNAALDRLEHCEARAAVLEGQTPAMDQRRALLERAEPALHRVMPAIREAERSIRERDAARDALDQLLRRSDEREKAYRQAQESRTGDEALARRKEEITGLLAETRKQLELFSALKQAEEARVRAQVGREACLARQNLVCRDIADKEATRRSVSERLDALRDADRLAAEALQEAENAGRIYTAIAGVGGIRERVRELTEREKALTANDTAFQSFTERVLEAKERYDLLYSRFLSGQAGLLATELRQNVEASGFGLCPVCGSRLDRSGLCHLAPENAETPSQEAVDTAKATAEGLEQERQKKKEQLDRAHNQQLAKRDMLLHTATELIPGCDSWEALLAPGYLPRIEEQARQRSAAARETLQKRREQVAERDALRESSAAAEQTLDALRAALETLRAEISQREQAFGAAEQGAAVLRQQLHYKSEQDAKDALSALQSENAKISNLLTAHESHERQCKERLDQVQGQLRSARQSLESREDAVVSAALGQENALRNAGFSSLEAVREALAPCRGTDPERWLQAEQKTLSDFEHERKALSETLSELRKQTAGQRRADLDSLDAAFQKTDAACQALRQDSRRHSQWLESCSQVRDRVAEHLSALRATESAWTRLSRLGALAAGSTGQGGKLSFERYVMGAVFREILDMANRRLDLMSGGRYQLEHKTAANRASAKAGLEIEILDLTTGKRRPSASLSGGEAFYTSLALALGLSDVVQSHAGGIRLEALFIDEGFGSLDDDMLDNALSVLSDLTRGDRLVGIISHVDKLGASIPQKIIVKNGPKGSSLRVVV